MKVVNIFGFEMEATHDHVDHIIVIDSLGNIDVVDPTSG